MKNMNNTWNTEELVAAHFMSLTDDTLSYNELNAMSDMEMLHLFESLTRDNYNLYGSEFVERLSKALDSDNRLLAYYSVLKANEAISQAYMDTQEMEFQFNDSDDLQRYQYEELDVELEGELEYLNLVN